LQNYNFVKAKLVPTSEVKKKKKKKNIHPKTFINMMSYKKPLHTMDMHFHGVG
jgi:hypothetical protein